MSGSVRVALCVALACVPGISAEASCPSVPGAQVYVRGQSCYEFVATADTWLSSRTYCRVRGGRLATISTSELQQWAASQAATLLPAGRGVWLGLNDRAKSGAFEWDNYNNAPLAGTYYNWQLGEPSGYSFLGQNCVYMDPSKEWRWAVSLCGFPVYGLSICEYSLLAQTSPTIQLSSVSSATITARSVMNSVTQTSQPSLTASSSKLLSSTNRDFQGSQTTIANYISSLLSSKSVLLTTGIRGLSTSLANATKPLDSTVSTAHRQPTSTRYVTTTITSPFLVRDTSTRLTSLVTVVGPSSENSVQLSATTSKWLVQTDRTTAQKTALASMPSSSVKGSTSGGNTTATAFTTSSGFSLPTVPTASTVNKAEGPPTVTIAGLLSRASGTTKHSGDSSQVSSTSTETLCPSAGGAKAFVRGQSCYEFVTAKQTWLNSRTYCHGKGGRLALVNTEQLHQWVTSQAATIFAGNQGVWLGLNDRTKSDDFVWDNYNNGTELASTYYNWQPGEPSGYSLLGQNCVYMDPPKGWRWAVSLCGFPVYGLSICEYSIAVSKSSSESALTLEETTTVNGNSSSQGETTPQAAKWTTTLEVNGTFPHSTDYSLGNASPTVSLIGTANKDADAAQAKLVTDRTHNFGSGSALAASGASAGSSDGKTLAMTTLPIYLPIVVVVVVVAIVTTATVLHQKHKRRQSALIGLQNPMFDLGMPVEATFTVPSAASSTDALVHGSKVT